jgi:hypothetical protein
MALEDLIKFQFKRVNPFEGLVLDANTWKDEQEYHRNQQRLHTLAFHGSGIVEGLEVRASQPAALSLTISPGMAVSPEGNVIVVSQRQSYNLVSKDRGQVHLIIQYREIPTAPVSEGEQPTRILEAYRIREVTHLPDEPYLELARIDLDASQKSITDAKAPSSPTVNEIDLRFRQSAKMAGEEQITLEHVAPREQVILGRVVLGEGANELHESGLTKLAHEVSVQNENLVTVAECILDESISRCTLLYVVGKGRFTMNSKGQAALGAFLHAGGSIFAEGCAEGEPGGSEQAKEFGLAFNHLAEQLGTKLAVVQRGHPLLDCRHVFVGPPPGAQLEGLLMAGGRILYSSYDYGCAWNGGYGNNPLPRDTIRSAFEMGVNILTRATMLKHQGVGGV